MRILRRGPGGLARQPARVRRVRIEGIVNQHQKTAIENHCRLAVETMHPRFHWARNGVSIILTVNSGYE